MLASSANQFLLTLTHSFWDQLVYVVRIHQFLKISIIKMSIFCFTCFYLHSLSHRFSYSLIYFLKLFWIFSHFLQEIYFHHLILCYPCFSKENVSAYSLLTNFCMLKNDIKVKRKIAFQMCLWIFCCNFERK